MKTNIGHLEAASGVAGLVKVVLALRNRVIPPHLHFRVPSPHIRWNELPLRVPTSALPWEPIDGRRIAGVSSFGFSGTNAHVVIEEAPMAPVGTESAHRPDFRSGLLTLSARTDTALRAVARRYAEAVKRCADSELADICFVANTGRAHMPQRATIVARTIDELRSRLLAVAEGDAADGVRTARWHYVILRAWHFCLPARDPSTPACRAVCTKRHPSFVPRSTIARRHWCRGWRDHCSISCFRRRQGIRRSTKPSTHSLLFSRLNMHYRVVALVGNRALCGDGPLIGRVRRSVHRRSVQRR